MNFKEDVNLAIEKARIRKSTKSDADFLKWAIGQPDTVDKMDYNRALDRVSESRATDKDVTLLRSLVG